MVQPGSTRPPFADPPAESPAESPAKQKTDGNGAPNGSAKKPAPRHAPGNGAPAPVVISDRRVSDAPARRQRWTSWLILLGCLAAALPPLLLDVYHADVVDPAEAEALATSIHTWQRLNTPRTEDETFIEELVPHYNGRRQWREPPGVTWMQLLSFEIAASPPGETFRSETVVDESGAVSLAAPFEKVEASGATLRELAAAVEEHAEEKLDWKRVDATASILAAPTPDDKAAKPSRLPGVDPAAYVPAAGDVVELRVKYVEPQWRSGVGTLNMIRWGRFGSVAMALLLLASVFWAGHSIGGPRTAMFATLICAANPALIWYARLASPPIHQAAWAMLSIAAALWAIRPLRPTPSVERQFLGWVVCGLAFGAAALATGPIVIVTVILPILLLLLICPNRTGHLMGLVAAVLIGVLLVTPWTALLHNEDPDAAGKWFAEHQPFGMQTLELLIGGIGGRLMLVLAVMLPWTIWLIGAMIQPFSTSSLGSRTRLFLGFSWFVAVTLILLTQRDAGAIDALLPLVPAGSLMIGQLFRQYTDLSEEARYPRFWRLLRWPHLLLLLGASIVAPLLIVDPQWFMRNGWISEPIALEQGWFYGVGLMLALLAIVGLAVHYSITHRPAKALFSFVAWVLVLMFATAIPVARNDLAKSEVRYDAEEIERLTWNNSYIGPEKEAVRHPVFAMHGKDESPIKLDPALLLYAGFEIRAVAGDQIKELAEKQKQPFFLVRRVQPRVINGDATKANGETENKAAAPRDEPDRLRTDPQAEFLGTMSNVGLELWKYTPIVETETTAMR